MVLATIVLILMSCKKESGETKSSSNTYEYTCTLKRYSFEDTLRIAIHESTKFKIVLGDPNEFRGGYSFALFINNELSQYLFMSNRSALDEIVTDGEIVAGVFVSDCNGNGYKFEGFRIYPRPNPPFIQILDFPFPGWNRFVKTDD